MMCKVAMINLHITLALSMNDATSTCLLLIRIYLKSILLHGERLLLKLVTANSIASGLLMVRINIIFSV